MPEGEDPFLKQLEGLENAGAEDGPASGQEAAESARAGSGGEKKAKKPGLIKRAMTRGEGVIASRPNQRGPSPKKGKGNLPAADEAELKKLIQDTVAACPEGYSRQVSSSVTIKGGVKLTSITITDTNMKTGKVVVKTQRLGTKAGMVGHHDKEGKAVH